MEIPTQKNRSCEIYLYDISVGKIFEWIKKKTLYSWQFLFLKSSLDEIWVFHWGLFISLIGKMQSQLYSISGHVSSCMFWDMKQIISVRKLHPASETTTATTLISLLMVSQSHFLLTRPLVMKSARRKTGVEWNLFACLSRMWSFWLLVVFWCGLPLYMSGRVERG